MGQLTKNEIFALAVQHLYISFCKQTPIYL
jgi:hypothetical protein